MTKFSLLLLIDFTTTILISTGGLKIAVLLQAFGFNVGLWGLANVLQCVIDKTALPKKVRWGKNLSFGVGLSVGLFYFQSVLVKLQ